MKLRRTMKAQSPKKKEKERNNKEKKKRTSVRGHAARISGKTWRYAARTININALCMFRFPTKRPLKIQQNPVKELGWDTQRLEILEMCSTTWDWDSSRGVPRNTRNEEQICPSQAPSGVAKNQRAWRVITYEQKASTSGNPKWRTIKRSG